MAKLPQTPLIWVTAGSAIIAQITAVAFNAIFAFALNDTKPGLQILIFVDFAINCLSIFPLAYLLTYYLPRVKNGTLDLKTAFCRRFLGMSLCTLVIAVGLSLATLIWASITIEDLPKRVAGRSSRVMVILWFGIWGLATLLQIATFVCFARVTLRGRSDSPESLDLGFGMRTPPEMKEEASARPTSESFRSQDPTLSSPPRTPSTIGLSNPYMSAHSTGKSAPTSRTKLVHSNSYTEESAKSSFDIASGDIASIDHPFDSWDTSSLARDIRNTMHSSRPVTRSGLPTIPGSRPESPAKPLDGPFLPSSPALECSQSSDADGIDRAIISSQLPSSPPSSPPNFSRPSRNSTQPGLDSPAQSIRADPSMESLIHPLFRSTSPQGLPLPRLGSMVAASPLAGQSISPKAVKRMRSASMPQQPSGLRQNIEPMQSHRESVGTSGIGSPGPSIYDEAQLSPVIPGFILSAGARDSIMGYDRRKSVRERRASFHSQGERLSMLLP